LTEAHGPDGSVDVSRSSIFVPDVDADGTVIDPNSGITYALGPIAYTVSKFGDNGDKFGICNWGGGVQEGQMQGQEQIFATHAFKWGLPLSVVGITAH
jgi:hypothetical protein